MATTVAAGIDGIATRTVGVAALSWLTVGVGIVAEAATAVVIAVIALVVPG